VVGERHRSRAGYRLQTVQLVRVSLFKKTREVYDP
jgi:23S rRNA U2552 (ribose-2'-O)-methylase RlmE/FtsJ